MNISPARRAAFEILRRVEEGSAHSSALLDEFESHLKSDDRALCHELVLGVLRRQLWLDRVLEHVADRPVAKMDLPARLGLRLGLYQLRFLSRIPPSAAVNESVNLVRASRVKSAAGFVNAVLRRATREPDYDPLEEISDRIERLAIETSHPRWLIERWIASFGFNEAALLARANNDAAPNAFRLTAKSSKDESISRIIGELEAAGVVVRSKVAPRAWRRERDSGVSHMRVARSLGGQIRDLATEGLIYFQDEASQLVAHLLGARDGDKVIDLCAAPGSKTTHIAALAPTASIFAGDRDRRRMVLLRNLSLLQGVNDLNLVVHDAVNCLPFMPASFDRVLADVPCSGTGTLRQNPEIRWRLKPEDFAALSSQQSHILNNAANMVRKGGTLIYSTCSVEPDENEFVARAFLADNHEFEQLDLVQSTDLPIEGGAVRTWPHRHDVDGFFIVALQRRR
jgi:16S rRNA (cytosine967-C5)-methyltransferase